MSVTREREAGDMTKKFIFDISEYESPSSRIEGFQTIEELGLNRPRPMLVLGHNAFEEYKRDGLTPNLQEAIRDAFNQIREQNPKRGAYVGRAFYVPGIEAPNGPRTASIRDESEYLDEVQKFWHFVQKNNYDIEGADVALILHPFIHVMDPPRTRYGSLQLSEDEVLPYSAGSVYPASLPGLPNRVEVRALFGPDEAIQSCPHDIFYIDPDSETILEKRTGHKDKTYVPQTGTNYLMVDIPKRFRDKQALTDPEAIAVAKWARNLKGVRAEFIVQEDGVFFREIAPYNPEEEYRLFRLEPGGTVSGPIICVRSQEDIKKISGLHPIVYLGPETFRERRTDLFTQVANSTKNKIVALVHGTIQTSHMARVLRDLGHSVVLVGTQRYIEGEDVVISSTKDGLPKIDYANPFVNSIVDLANTDRLGKGEAGKKLARLSIMHSAGIRIPSGFAIISEALWKHINDIGILGQIKHLDTVGITNNQEVNSLTQNIQERILASSFHQEFASQIEKAVSRCNFDKYVIRSSGDEDGKDTSMAGLFESHTNVDPGMIKKKVPVTLASYFSAAAVTSLRSTGKKPSEVSLGVGIQEYIYDPLDESQIGGTLFTYPDRMVVETVKGTPELIVSGNAKGHVRVTIDRLSGEKKVEQLGNGRTFSKLTENAQAVLPELTRTAWEIEMLFVDYQDIEWVYNQKHGLVIVQARPL